MVNVSGSNRRCYNTFAERTGVYVLRGGWFSLLLACKRPADAMSAERIFHGICRMIMCACFLVFGDCFLVLIAFSNLVFRSLSPNAHRCVVRFRSKLHVNCPRHSCLFHQPLMKLEHCGICSRPINHLHIRYILPDIVSLSRTVAWSTKHAEPYERLLRQENLYICFSGVGGRGGSP